jgi:hypothetical protein
VDHARPSAAANVQLYTVLMVKKLLVVLRNVAIYGVTTSYQGSPLK